MWWRTELHVEWVARVANALLIYLAWFWQEFALVRPVEVEVSFVSLSKVTIPANPFRVTQPTVVEPAGVSVDDLAAGKRSSPGSCSEPPFVTGSSTGSAIDLNKRSASLVIPSCSSGADSSIRVASLTGLVLNRSVIWGCPDDFVPDVRQLNQQLPRYLGNAPREAPVGAVLPSPTGKWSAMALQDLFH